MTLVIPANPSAGSNLSIVNPAGGFPYILRSIMYTLSSSATVADRFPQVFIDDNNGHDIALVLDGTALKASDNIVVSCWGNAGNSINFGDFITYMPLPDIVIMPTWRVLIGATSLQAGDQLSGASFTYDVA